MHKSDAMLQELPSYMHVTTITFFNRLRTSVEKKALRTSGVLNASLRSV